ncbi:hypothetical protein AVEN_52650-1 [Araneus ventricosus]|uniref:Helitron helicase-like domain-containing protein n=1 Tax=Araneus ventricosus TaxID=182803 RepID=A0A4Y2N3B5_ARAVE|nr:hypothetical protein AVEN_52650-1 [Araneus ventricosus]
MEFYAFRIMIRTESSNHILLYRQLFHQYKIDMCAKIESGRLLYIKLNQQKLRLEEYIHLRDAITNDGNVTDIARIRAGRNKSGAWCKVHLRDLENNFVK